VEASFGSPPPEGQHRLLVDAHLERRGERVPRHHGREHHHQPIGYALGIVSGSHDDGQEVRDNLGAVWRRGHERFLEPGGFKAFDDSLERHMERLLLPFNPQAAAHSL
jgi:hypothetical protein